MKNIILCIDSEKYLRKQLDFIFEKNYNDFYKYKKLFMKNHEIIEIRSYLNGNVQEGKHYFRKAYQASFLNYELLLKYILMQLYVSIYKKVYLFFFDKLGRNIV